MYPVMKTVIVYITIGFLIQLSSMGVLYAQVTSSDIVVDDYSRLLHFINGDHLEAPLLLLADSQGEFDQRLNRENMDYLNQNKGLLERIQGRLNADSMKWELSGSSKRLLVVPEHRPEYARLFEGYCRRAVDYTLNRTQLANPYLQIATLQAPVALENEDAGRGITAYLVHNIADEYIEEYLFYKQEDRRTKIKIKLSNRVFTGRIGSYTSRLTIGQDSRIEFVRDPYTLWQNSAKNPINVLVVPIEETLHIALRPATETAIRTRLEQKKPENIQDVEAVVQEWMAVEEAIVGGLVSRLMPEIFARLLSSAMEKEMADSLAERDAHEQYRYLQQGIRVVTDLGVRPAIDLYLSEPVRFQQLIGSTELAAAL